MKRPKFLRFDNAVTALTTPPVLALQLPSDPYKGFGSPTDRSPGYYISSTIAALCAQAVPKLRQIPNAQPADINTFVESAWGAYRLGQSLERVDGELITRSNGELKFEIDEFTPWEWRDTVLSAMIRGGGGLRRIFRYRPESAEKTRDLPRDLQPGEVGPHVARQQKKAQQWIDEHLSDVERRDFTALLQHRLELRLAAQKAYAEFLETCDEIDKAAGKAQAIASAQKLNRELVLEGQPEYELENVQAGLDAVKAISAGLDTAWPTKPTFERDDQ